jgi:hypothetical protein
VGRLRARHTRDVEDVVAYLIILRLETHAAAGRLRSFYESVNLPDSLAAADLVIGVAPWAEYETPGHARVDFLVLGDEGIDIRCM